MPDRAALCAHLPESRRAIVVRVHRHHRRTFRAAVAFERPNAEAILERRRHSLRQFLRTHDHQPQTAEIFRRAFSQIALQKCRRRNQKRNSVLANQRADGAEIKRARMIGDANSDHRRKPQRHRESEGMKEGQHAEKRVVAVELHGLRHLLHVRHDIEMRQHHAFRLAGAAARKDDRRQIVKTRTTLAAQHALEQTRRQRPEQRGNDFFAEILDWRRPLLAECVRPGGLIGNCRAASSS